METFTIEIDAPALAVALHNAVLFAGTDETIPVLNAVRFHALQDGELKLAATNRYVLGVSTLKAVSAPACEGQLVPFGMPLRFAKDVLKQVKGVKVGTVEITVSGEGNPDYYSYSDGPTTITVSYPGGTMSGATQPGQFPKFESLIPDAAEVGSEAGQQLIGVATQWLAVLGKIKSAEAKTPALRMSVSSASGKPVRFDLEGELTCLVMPTRFTT